MRNSVTTLSPKTTRNDKIKETYCIKSCLKKIDNEHLTWREKLNDEYNFRYAKLINGNLMEKIQTMKQIKSNERRRREQINYLVIH